MTTDEVPDRIIVATPRLVLREFKHGDAAFLLALMNDPDYHAHITDKGLRSEADAIAFMDTSTLPHYAGHGYGLWLAADRETGVPVGMIGLVKRDSLDHADIGFAMLPAFRGRGLVQEGAAACLELGRDRWAMRRILGVVSADNIASVTVLTKLGLVPEGHMIWPGTDDRVELYGRDL